MFLCQQLENMTDKRYWPDYWRVVTLRVVLKPATDRLVWERRDTTDWKRLAGGVPGHERARRELTPGVAVIESARHGANVTQAQASKLTGLMAPVCMDYLRENWDSRPEPVLPPAKPKKAEPTPAQVAMGKSAKAEKRIEDIDKKIARLNTLKRKWEKRARYYASRAAKLDQPVASAD